MTAQLPFQSLRSQGSWDTAKPWASTTQGHQRSLRSKLVLSLAAMCSIFLVIDEAVRLIVIQPAFEDLEYASAIRDANRVMSAIKVESEHLRAIAEQGRSRLKPIESEASPGRLTNPLEPDSSVHFEGVQWAAIAGENGSWRWIFRNDEPDESSDDAIQSDSIANSILSQISGSDLLVNDGLACDGKRQIHAYASAPIDPAQMSGNELPTPLAASVPADGYHLVVGKQLDQALIAELGRRTQVTFSIQLYHRQKFDKKIRTWEADESTLVVEAPLVQSDHETLANLFVQVPRDVVQQAKHTTALARNVFVCGAAATLILILLQLQRIVVGPLTRIREHTERIAENGFDTRPLSLTSNDEIGALATAFDHMKTRLADTHNRLADASHAAGMSQVADTVIHNVGNVLTNVNSLIETATDRVDGLRVAPLNKLASRLRQGDDKVALVAATPDYLQRLSVELEKDQNELSELLATLSDNVQHIHSVIRDQRRHTLKTVDKKLISMRDIVDEAVNCCQAKLQQDQITVHFAASHDYIVKSDRSLLLQVIINLIGNAGNAMGESDCSTPHLHLSLTDQDDLVRLAVRDQGCGMSQETLAQVFHAHFTTRATGTGLGLHFCAIAMKRLGGAINVQSDGLGKGSTFLIELPIAEKQQGRNTDGVTIDSLNQDNFIAHALPPSNS